MVRTISVNLSCCCRSAAGITPVDLYRNESIAAIESANAAVRAGGRWGPADCRAWQKVAVIVPYRDRWLHLKILLKRLHGLLQKQKIYYQIFVVDQVGRLADQPNVQACQCSK